MTIGLIAFVLALIAVAAGELAELPFARRKADAGRSRLQATQERARLRW